MRTEHGIRSEVATLALGCPGALLNVAAVVVLLRHKDLTASFRVMMVSLATADLGLTLAAVFTSSVAIAWTWNPEVLSLSKFKMVALVSFPWVIALVGMVTLPAVAIVSGSANAHMQTGWDHLSCWPLVAVEESVLTLQSILLLVSSVGVAVTHTVTLRKLTRRAILVLPVFGTRTSDSTSKERRQTRRNTLHAASQAFTFLVVHLPFALLLLWLVFAEVDRRAVAPEVWFLALSVLPLVNSIINPTLFFWRLVPTCMGHGPEAENPTDTVNPPSDKNPAPMASAGPSEHKRDLGYADQTRADPSLLTRSSLSKSESDTSRSSSHTSCHSGRTSQTKCVSSVRKNKVHPQNHNTHLPVVESSEADDQDRDSEKYVAVSTVAPSGVASRSPQARYDVKKGDSRADPGLLTRAPRE
nr:hypothetical protein BaRGS_013660 [Batillaria attramentaria]